MSADDTILKKILTDIEHARSWSASDARTKFDKLLEQAIDGPQIIAPLRGHNSEKFVCMSLSQLTGISHEMKRLQLQLRQQNTADVLQQVRDLYKNIDGDLLIVREPEKKPVDFGFGDK